MKWWGKCEKQGATKEFDAVGPKWGVKLEDITLLPSFTKRFVHSGFLCMWNIVLKWVSESRYCAISDQKLKTRRKRILWQYTHIYVNNMRELSGGRAKFLNMWCVKRVS